MFFPHALHPSESTANVICEQITSSRSCTTCSTVEFNSWIPWEHWASKQVSWYSSVQSSQWPTSSHRTDGSMHREPSHRKPPPVSINRTAFVKHTALLDVCGICLTFSAYVRANHWNFVEVVRAVRNSVARLSVGRVYFLSIDRRALDFCAYNIKA